MSERERRWGTIKRRELGGEKNLGNERKQQRRENNYPELEERPSQDSEASKTGQTEPSVS